MNLTDLMPSKIYSKALTYMYNIIIFCNTSQILSLPPVPHTRTHTHTHSHTHTHTFKKPLEQLTRSACYSEGKSKLFIILTFSC